MSIPRFVGANRMLSSTRRGAKVNAAVVTNARRGMNSARGGINRALPTGTRRRNVVLGQTKAGRRARMGAAAVVGGGLGMNAMVGPQYRGNSGVSGLRGHSSGGRGAY